MRLYQWMHLSTTHCHINAEKHSYCYCYFCYWEKIQRMDINRWMLTKFIVVIVSLSNECVCVYIYIYIYVCMYICLVVHSCRTFCNPIDCNQAYLSMGLLKARLLEWVAMPSYRGYSQPRIKPRSPIAGGFFTIWTTREAYICIYTHTHTHTHTYVYIYSKHQIIMLYNCPWYPWGMSSSHRN